MARVATAERGGKKSSSSLGEPDTQSVENRDMYAKVIWAQKREGASEKGEKEKNLL